ncbi:MAG: hypothetical protein HY078_16155 [Elusimicrobia bacterium]|nr:hypothetical protein [Elusimicrobiota bacterium]
MKTLRGLRRDEKGQNTVEYLLMLSVVVGVVLVLGRLFKPGIGGIFEKIIAMIQGAIISMGGS